MTEIERLQMNANQANSDFVAIKGKIVEKGVEVADGTRTAEYASKVDEVYEKGKKAQYDEFWDSYQGNGKRRNYQYAFAGNDGSTYSAWTDVTFKPKYDIILGAGFSGTNTFWNCQVSNIAEALENQGVKLDTSLCGFMSQIFQGAKTKRIPEINCSHVMDYSPNGLHYTFRDCSLLETIDKLIVTENLVFSTTFNGCTNLKEVTFEGVIGQDGLNLQWSTKLSKASWISIIDALSSTATGKSITGSLESVKRAFKTSAGAMDGDSSAEWLNLIASKSNWTINLV